MGLLQTISNGAKIASTHISAAAPDILTYVGIGVLFASGIKAAVDSKNVEKILDEQNDLLDQITESHTEEEMELPSVKKEIRKVRVKTVGRMAWNYKWAALLAVTGAGMILYGHHIIKGRLVATTIIADSIQKAYDIAMDRARDKYGDAAVKYLKYGIEEEIVEEEVEDEKGKKHKQKVTRDICYNDICGDPNVVVFGPDTSLYKECQGSLVYMRSQAKQYENVLNEQYNAGLVITKNEILRWLCGSDSDRIDDAGQILGYSKNDPTNVELNKEGRINLNLFTYQGCDPDTGEDKMYLAMCPNIPGIVSFDISRKKRGKYIAA